PAQTEFPQAGRGRHPGRTDRRDVDTNRRATRCAVSLPSRGVAGASRAGPARPRPALKIRSANLGSAMFDSPIDLMSLVIAVAPFMFARKARQQVARLRERLETLEAKGAAPDVRPAPTQFEQAPPSAPAPEPAPAMAAEAAPPETEAAAGVPPPPLPPAG